MSIPRITSSIHPRLRHAALLHLSTCYVAGQRDGTGERAIAPELHAGGRGGFRCGRRMALVCTTLVESAEARAESPEVTEELRKQALEKEHAAKGLSGQALENQIRKNRVRWLKNYLTEEGDAPRQRVRLAEYLHVHQKPGGIADREVMEQGLPIAIVRPAIVETSVQKPFRGMERRHQHFGVALVFAGYGLPATAFERTQAARHYSGGFGLRGNDADRCGAGRAPS